MLQGIAGDVQRAPYNLLSAPWPANPHDKAIVEVFQDKFSPAYYQRVSCRSKTNTNLCQKKEHVLPGPALARQGPPQLARGLRLGERKATKK